MSNSKLKRIFDDDDVRDIELSLLKSKIIDAIRFSERYWLIYKESTFGIATIIDLIYKKSYLEILFFTNRDVIKKGVPLVKIYTPTATQFDFNEVLVEPDFDEDNTISPVKIIKKLNELIEKEIGYHLSVLEEEVQLIDKKYENYMIYDNPYFRKILIYFPDYRVKLRINFENYPDIPNLSEKKQLVIKSYKEPLSETIKDKFLDMYMITPLENPDKEIKIFDEREELIIEKHPETYFDKLINKFDDLLKENYSINIRRIKDTVDVIREKDFNNMDIIRKWNIENPPHIIDVIESIIQVGEGTQDVILNKVYITDEIQNISFKVHRGQSLGLYYESEKVDHSVTREGIEALFKIMLGQNLNYSGEISIFGKKFQPGSKNEIEGVFWASGDIDPKMIHNSIKRAILHNIYFKGKRKKKKELINKTLEATGLLNRRHEKLRKLSKLNRILFTISRGLLTMQSVILISLPLSGIGRLESEQFNRYIENIKRNFHVVLIVHGPKEIISTCDQIITIKAKQTEIGTINHYISKIPHSGELITIELDNPDKIVLDKMFKITSAVFIEERKNERYKIYCIDEDPNAIINKLMASIGEYIYNFKIHKASLTDYLQLLKINEKYVNIELNEKE